MKNKIVYYLYHKQKNNKLLIAFVSKVSYLLKKNKRCINGTNNEINCPEAFLERTSININGNNNEVTICKGVKLKNTKIVIKGNNHKLVVGEGSIIGSGTFWFEDENCTIHIGSNTTIEDAGISVTEPNSNIILGSECMLSFGIDIRNGDSHSIIDLENNTRINYARDIYIGKHVWIGANVQILKGVNIGDNSIIGTRTLVTKDIPRNSIACGCPAKVVKQNINWLRERIYGN